MKGWLKLILNRGGKSVGVRGIRDGDIVVSSTCGKTSGIIRWFTNSPVSHAMVVSDARKGEVIEATADGVIRRSLQDALEDASIAIVLRHPDIDAVRAMSVISELEQLVGMPYDTIGVAKLGWDLQVGSSSCDGRPNQRLFCSELIADGFKSAGFDLTQKPASCSSPDDIADGVSAGVLDYVGHLVTDGNGDRELTVDLDYDGSASFIEVDEAGAEDVNSFHESDTIDAYDSGYYDEYLMPGEECNDAFLGFDGHVPDGR